MKIDRDTLHKTAHLARLQISPEEEEGLIARFSTILDWVEQLKEVDTEGVEPLTHMTYEVSRFRADEPGTSLPREDALKLAPDSDGTFFKVPKVLD